jgi:hypothetical protein
VKRRRDTRLFEQSSRLFANAHPRLVGVSIAPFVKQDTARSEHAIRLSQNRAPVCSEIEEAGNDDTIERSRRKRKACSFGDDRLHSTRLVLVAQLGEHAGSRFDDRYAASARCQWNRHATSTGAHVEHTIAGSKPCGAPEPIETIVGQHGAVPVIVDGGVSREIDALGHEREIPRPTGSTNSIALPSGYFRRPE